MKKVFLRVLLVLSLSLCGACSHLAGDEALEQGNAQQAARLYLEDAEAGQAEAALKLGQLLLDGRVRGSQYETAAHWFMKACELGSLSGCHNAALAFEDGTNGAEKDLLKAKEYYLVAAENGYIQSQYNLGCMYADKCVTPPDDVEGYKWMLIAQKAAKGCLGEDVCKWVLKDPPGNVAKLKNRLSESEIQKAEDEAEEWQPRRGSDQ